MSDYEVGDVVVRIGEPNWARSAAPPLGKPVRVIGMSNRGDRTGAEIDGYPSPHWTREWGAEHFRKLPKATDEFTRQIRACRPNKSRQPA